MRGASVQERASVAILGAGPAGLAVAACLARRGVDAALFEASARVGDSWRRHYDRLHLHTHKRFSALPYHPWPVEAPAYPSRDEVVAYLERYAQAERLDVRLGEEVARVARDADGWAVSTSGTRLRARHLVLATGLNHLPVVPSWPGSAEAEMELLHSSAYRSGARFRGHRVLVVGFGNSGAEIALDLAEHGARVTVSVRSPVAVVPRRVLGLPIEQLAGWLGRLPPAVASGVAATVRRARYGDLPRRGLRLAHASPLERVRERGRLPVIDVGTVGLIRRGRIAVRPGIRAFDGGEVHFDDGSRSAFDAVVLATGYRPGYPELMEGVAPRGPADPPPSGPGLHSCGLRVTAGGTLRRIAEEAPRVADAIAADLASSPATT